MMVVVVGRRTWKDAAVLTAWFAAGWGCRGHFDVTPDANRGSNDAGCEPFASATFYGISADDRLGPVLVTSDGDVIAATVTALAEYPGTTGGAQPAYSGGGGSDALLVRYTHDLSVLEQATYFGGIGRELAFRFALGPGESPIIAAWSTGGWPVTTGAATTTYDNSGDDWAVARLSSDLTTTIAGTYWGANDPADEQLGGVCTNPISDDIYLVGEHLLGTSPTFTAPGFDLIKNGGTDGAAIRYNSSLSAVLGNTLKGLGSAANAGKFAEPGEEALGMCRVTPSGDEIYFTGRPGGVLVGTQATAGAYVVTPVDVNDPFICRYTADLTIELACTHLGITGGVGLARDWSPSELLVHPNGDLYVVQTVPSTITWIPATSGAYQSAPAGGIDIAITRFSADLSSVVASTFIGTSGDDEANVAAVLPDGSIAIGGRTSGALPTTSGAIQPTPPGGGVDGMLLVIDEDLATLRVASYFGDPSANDVVTGLAVHAATGSLYLSGASGGGFPVTDGGAQPTHGGGVTDGYVARISICNL